MQPLIRFAAVGALALTARAADFSYYMLAMSYAPNYCAQPGADRNVRECGSAAPSFVVHGLWPQNERGRGPESCGPARPVAEGIVTAALKYLPTEKLVQHEWATHGTCTGLSPADYFAALERLADSVRMPPELDEVSGLAHITVESLENLFGRYNPGIPRNGFRVSCYADNGLKEIRVCFDKNYAARPCTGVPDCTKINVVLRPTPRRR